MTPSTEPPVMQIGAYSFGDAQRESDGSLRSTGEAVRDLLGAIVLADRAGLDYFGVGEHHTADLPVSSPAAMVAGAAAATTQIRLGSSVAVLSTDDPVRLYEQFATADAFAPGRVELTVGRGSTGESFPLFGHHPSDYDRLYAEKLDLLLAIDRSRDGRVDWSGSVRTPLDRSSVVVPRPVAGHLPIWLGTGGSAPSSARAGRLGLPVAYGIIGGIPARFAPLAALYRAAAARSGHSGPTIRIAVGTWGLVAPTTREAKERFYPGWRRVQLEAGGPRGWPAPTLERFDAMTSAPGAYLVGDPDEVAARIVDLHGHLGHVRHMLQADIGGLPHEHFLDHLTLLATEVKPRVDRLLAR